jgi:hypothetical protein
VHGVTVVYNDPLHTPEHYNFRDTASLVHFSTIANPKGNE